MTTQAVTLHLPENLYVRLQQAAQATRQSFDAVVLRALQVGAPPSWEDAPTPFQADLAVLDQLDDDCLWHIARSRQTAADMTRYQELLEKNANNTIADTERAELTSLRVEILQRAHPLAWCAPSHLYAVAYRPTQAAAAQRLDVWPEALAVGAALPTMPLWVSEELCLPLALEESYRATCVALRIRVRGAHGKQLPSALQASWLLVLDRNTPRFSSGLTSAIIL